MPLPYFPVEDGSYKITLGLKPAKTALWLDVDNNYDAETSLKRKLFKTRRQAVFATVPGAQPSEEKILSLVQSSLKDTYPLLQTAPAFENSNALIRAASLVQEDLVLMLHQGEKFILGAAAVCFPSGWDLHEKVGKTLPEIHMPVPGLNPAIEGSIDKFFNSLKPHKIIQRYNWGLFDSDALFQPKDQRKKQPGKLDITPNNIGEKLFFRVEKQTLQRLENSKDILFTIRIFNTPLAEVAAQPDRANKLHQALTTMPHALRHYKAVAGYENMLLSYLAKSALV